MSDMDSVDEVKDVLVGISLILLCMVIILGIAFALGAGITFALLSVGGF